MTTIISIRESARIMRDGDKTRETRIKCATEKPVALDCARKSTQRANAWLVSARHTKTSVRIMTLTVNRCEIGQKNLYNIYNIKLIYISITLLIIILFKFIYITIYMVLSIKYFYR